MLLALANRGDTQHYRVSTAVAQLHDSLVVPVSVLPEVDYLLTRRRGAHAAVSALSAFTSGSFQLEGILHTDMPRILELMRQYLDSNIGFVDASLVALAERLDIQRILTLDRRHFRPIRPRHCATLEILP